MRAVLMVLLSDTLITFKQRGTGETLGPLLVNITALSVTEELIAQGVKFMYAVSYETGLRFSNNQPIGDGDRIIWDGIQDGEAELRRPRVVTTLGFSSAHFQDTA